MFPAGQKKRQAAEGPENRRVSLSTRAALSRPRQLTKCLLLEEEVAGDWAH